MSTSTVTDNYSWIHMQQQGHVVQSRRENKHHHQEQTPRYRPTLYNLSIQKVVNDNNSKIRRPRYHDNNTTSATKMLGDQSVGTGTRYTKSTASSRSRATQQQEQQEQEPRGTRKTIKELMQNMQTESGMSRDGIFEAFAKLSKDEVAETRHEPALSGRRKSTAAAAVTVAPQANSTVDVRLRRRKSRVAEEQEQQQQISSETKQTTTNRTRANTITNSPVPKRTTATAQTAAAAGGGRRNNEQQSRCVRTISIKKPTDGLQQRRRSSLGTVLTSSPGKQQEQVQPKLTHRPSHGTDEGSSALLPELATDQNKGSGITDPPCTEPTAAENGTSASSITTKTRLGPSQPHQPSPVKTSCPEKESTTGLFKDILAVKRKQVRQEFGLPSEVTAAQRTASEAPAPVLNTDSRRKSTTTTIANANLKRKMSLGKEKTVPSGVSTHEPRRRALSSGSILRANSAKCELGRRKSTTTTTGGSDQQSYMRPTLADMRRRSLAGGGEDREESLVMLATKRSSAIAASRANGGRSTTTAVSRNGTSGSGDDESPSSAKKANEVQHRRASKGSILAQDSEERSTSSVAIRMRKKSIVAMDDSSINVRRARRMSRTDSLKQGVPTSPSLNAAFVWRKKSEAAYDAFLSSKDSVKTTAATNRENRPARKRGKTLPGSLATPPLVQSINLPPMKMEPIRIAIPKRVDKKTSAATPRTPKSTSPGRKTNTSGSSSSEDDNRAQQLKKNGPDVAGRRSSIKTPRVAPAAPAGQPKEMGIGTGSASASPKSRPVQTQRPGAASLRKLSISNAAFKNAVGDELSPSIGALTTARTKDSNDIYGVVPSRVAGLYTNSRRSSIASIASTNIELESVADKEVGIQRHQVTSLKEKLNAMVREHDENTAIKHVGALDMEYTSMSNSRAHRRYGYELENKENTQTIAAGGVPLVQTPTTLNDTYAWEKELIDLAAITSFRGPRSPTTTVRCFSSYLMPFELTEIQKYKQVYFIGHHAQKHPATMDERAYNYGYDDERGDYKIVLQDHLAYRYEVIDGLGRGSFGQVVKCFDHKTGDTVAIKLIRNQKRFHAQGRTEIKILQDLIEWDPHDQHHNIRMTDFFMFRGHLCIAFECMSMNLYEFIQLNNLRGFSKSLIKRFTKQLLQSLCLLYEHGVIHCDLKPENILLKHPSKKTIKVIDFGSSCFETDTVYTYIQSRFYRSPEVILGMSYNMAIDMWSLGCIIAELYTGTPIFPGENEIEQLAYIMEILGTPSRYLIAQSSRRKLFFDSNGNPRIIPNAKGVKRWPGTKTLAQALRCNDMLFLDFIEQCLQWDPMKRMTPDQALTHDWILQSSRDSSQRQATVIVCNNNGGKQKVERGSP